MIYIYPKSQAGVCDELMIDGLMTTTIVAIVDDGAAAGPSTHSESRSDEFGLRRTVGDSSAAVFPVELLRTPPGLQQPHR